MSYCHPITANKENKKSSFETKVIEIFSDVGSPLEQNPLWFSFGLLFELIKGQLMYFNQSLKNSKYYFQLWISMAERRVLKNLGYSSLPFFCVSALHSVWSRWPQCLPLFKRVWTKMRWCGRKQGKQYGMWVNTYSYTNLCLFVRLQNSCTTVISDLSDPSHLQPNSDNK